MDETQLFSRLHQLTGNLKPANPAESRELDALQQTLAQALLNHPELTVTGNQLLDFGTTPQPGALPSEAATAKFTRIAELLQQPHPGAFSVPAPLIFRRDTAFRTGLLGNSIPEWGVGLAPGKSFGPITSEHGLPVWFDFFFPVRMVQVSFAGGTNPVLAIPLSGMLTSQKSYKLGPGSAWIASGGDTAIQSVTLAQARPAH